MLLKPAPMEPALQQVRQLQEAIQMLGTWAIREIVGDDIYPGLLPLELDAILRDMSGLCDQLSRTLSQIREDDTRVIYEILRNQQSGTPLSEEQYYLCRALGALNLPDNSCAEYEAYLLALK